jgi:TRAP-type mannitol/chloroaromatic compound transport system permease large subunit
MSGFQLGALIGLALGAVGFFAMKALARRVELDETKQVLNMAAIVDIVLFPVLGAFAGGLVSGD